MELSPPTSSVKELKDIAVGSVDFLVNEFSRDWQTFSIKYNFALNDYFKAKLEIVSKIKPIFTSQSVNLREIYVPQDVRFKNRSYNFDEIYKLISGNKSLIFTATAGAGKSCLFKAIFLDIIENKKDYFPLFFEMRKLNDSNKSIIESLIEDISHFNKKFTHENLAIIFNKKKSLLVLDGFDEINFDKKDIYFKEIMKITEIYPNLKIIISSRAEMNGFSEWNLFSVISLQPLTLEQSCLVIQKLVYESEVKERFIKSLRNSLFKQHVEFASNPLLLTIMFFTYEQNGNVPEKMHIFYDQAYQVLFNKHDGYKQGFARKSLTNLDMQKFKIVFSLFCLTTYCKEQFEFNDTELTILLKKCLKATDNSSVSEKDFKIELISNVPLIIQDGLEYCFSHRSFQEYFSAFYLTYQQENMSKILEIIDKRIKTDRVIDMLFEMNQELLEKNWILPKIEEILNNVDTGNSIEARLSNTKLFYNGVLITSINGDDKLKFYIDASKTIHFAYFLFEKYDVNSMLVMNLDENIVSLQELVDKFGDRISLNTLNNLDSKRFIELNGDWRAKNLIKGLEKVRKLILKKQNSSTATIDSLLFGL